MQVIHKYFLPALALSNLTPKQANNSVLFPNQIPYLKPELIELGFLLLVLLLDGSCLFSVQYQYQIAV
ncbi:hypothetical protein XBKB1_1120021 [Xenorhabdus bovienii str. kraussei Becker Underwood]|uniref:Uncharacterized protein n=1 Tax=Xenorhabdus bovienii str. kraussei Becker Underwood TaxID=1398204 RepID=A0A077PNU2_XENBV|nr:hypothetical protein XBKB1_1120021 [Xenorhabdus bovienii str. kraussei Becker Underwood]